MSRESFDNYERDSLLRAEGQYRHPRGKPGDNTAQSIIRNSERRKAKSKQPAGAAA
ncbi:hypothetical protein P8F81_07995 [Kosakonia cowanii]|uniref:hypothetical protein n=1 Tax=Kosakonia cowanii TaxID=208223 RepID=UPI002DDD15DF|nr:hypothetical protein [Kosakonia cowanii]WRY60924.1 hypothetical protein P8F81_07995 [Kosakonia cowanii]